MVTSSLSGPIRAVACAFALLLCLQTGAEACVIRLATTTSTDNSGLLKQMLPPFENSSGCRVDVIAVGTGKALRMGQDGDVDVVLVHARKAELKFVEAGFGVGRREIMYNDFVILGPTEDPAGIAGLRDAPKAFQRIADKQAPFISRGDDSGTHKKEREVWQLAGTTPKGRWYREVGQGMGKVLQIAGEQDAYTLSDRGTWLAFRKNSRLKLLATGARHLLNTYGIIAVNPARFPDLNYVGATKLMDWFSSTDGQTIIANFTIDGEPLFNPLFMAGSKAQ